MKIPQLQEYKDDLEMVIRKKKGKQYADSRRNAHENRIQPGDKVLA